MMRSAARTLSSALVKGQLWLMMQCDAGSVVLHGCYALCEVFPKSVFPETQGRGGEAKRCGGGLAQLMF